MNSFQVGLLKLLTSSLLMMMSILAAVASDVVVSPCASATAGKGNWGHVAAGYREFITIGQKYRIRQSGTITMIKLYTADSANITGFYIKIWRKSGNGYDLVGKSENLANRLVNGDFATITLNTPIAGIQEGDYCGYRLEESGEHYAFYATRDSNVATCLMTDTTPGEKDFNWEAQSKISDLVLPIELYMASPDIVFIGDSIMAGFPSHRSFLEIASKTDTASTIEWHFYSLTKNSYQNMAIGSQTTVNIASRFYNDVVRLKPKIVIIEGGVNDIATGKATKSEFLNSWAEMLKSANDNNIQAVVLLILPWTNGNAAQMNTLDDWNSALKIMAVEYGAIVVDAKEYVGQTRAGGPEGNFWNIQPQYNVDGVHFNSDGHKKIAEAIRDSFKKNKVGVDIAAKTSVSGVNGIAESKTISQSVNSRKGTKVLTPVAACRFKGKPIFPIGTWTAIDNGKIEQEWLDAGCNFIVYTNIRKGFGSADQGKSNEAAQKNLEALRDTPEYRDVAVVLALETELITCDRALIPPAQLPGYIAELNAVLANTAKYPNVLGYTFDEPENTLYESFGKLKNTQGQSLAQWMNRELKWTYDTIKQKCPDTYVMPTLAWWNSYMDTPDLYDVLMINTYPVAEKGKLYSGNFYDVVYDTALAVDAVRARGKTSVIFIPPVFDNLKWPPWGNGRAPSYEEQRYMCFAPIATGAMGIAGWVLYRATPEYRKAVIYPVFREVKRFVPWFLGEWHDEKVTSDHDIASVDYLKQFPERVMLLPGEKVDRTNGKKTAGVPDCSHALRYRSDNNSYLLLAVNNRKEPVTVNFKLDIPVPKKITEALQLREVNLSNGTLTDKFGPFDVHAYIIEY
jgi:lysophospholipase L1-like esterase